MKFSGLLPVLFLFINHVDAYVQVELQPYMWKTIDPIRAPGLYDTHLHMAAGSDALTANTAGTDDLMDGCTNADNPNDLSVYWIPALINKHTGAPLKPSRFGAYYFNIVEGITQPYPKDLKLIAGNFQNQELSGVDVDGAAPHWHCETYNSRGFQKRDPEASPSGDIIGDKPFAAMPNTVCQDVLHMFISFPNCVDPNDLSKYTYAPGSSLQQMGACPDGMINIPQLRLSVRWVTGGLVPSEDLILASGNEFSIHADFINAWHPVSSINMLKATAPVSSGQVQYVDGPIPKKTCIPRDREPDRGLGCYTGHKPTMPGTSSSHRKGLLSRRDAHAGRSRRSGRGSHRRPAVTPAEEAATAAARAAQAAYGTLYDQHNPMCLGPSIRGL